MPPPPDLPAWPDSPVTGPDAAHDTSSDTGTLGKAVALLDLVAGADVPLRFSDLLRLSGQPRGSLHRQLRHLVIEGLLDLSPAGTYTPGFRLLTFASKAWSRNSARQIAEPHMHKLHELTGETVHFGRLRGSQIVYLDKLESRQAVRMHSQVGNASPVYCTGVGKAALSCLDPSDCAGLVRSLTFVAFTPQTLTDPVRLLAAIDDIRSRGFAYDLEEHQPGICCVAAPIRVDAQAFVGGISVTAPAFRADMQRLAAWSVPLKLAAAAIASDLAHALAPRQ